MKMSAGAEDTERRQPPLDFRSILQDEFGKRNEVNSRYTLGAFAKQISLSPSRLREILSGRYGLSRSAAEDIADKLEFDAEQKRFFIDLVESKHGRSTLHRKLASQRLQMHLKRSQFKELEIDAFHTICDWYHFAILSLTYLSSFKSDAKWISQRLGISIKNAHESIAKLLRLGLLKQDEESNLAATEDYTKVGNQLPSVAIKSHHNQMIDKARAALLDQPVDKREFLSLTLAIDQSRLEEAKEMMQKFEMEFSQRFSTSSKKDSLYGLTMQFFRLDQNQENPDA